MLFLCFKGALNGSPELSFFNNVGMKGVGVKNMISSRFLLYPSLGLAFSLYAYTDQCRFMFLSGEGLKKITSLHSSHI